MEVNFGVLGKGIAQREAEIKKNRAEIGTMLIMNEGLNVTIDPAEELRARDIMAKINQLKAANQKDHAYSNLAIQLATEHMIKLDGNDLNLNSLISDERNAIHFGIQALKKQFLAGQLNAATFEDESSKIKRAHEDRIKEIEKIIAELSAFSEQ